MDLTLERLEIRPMASGNGSLLLTEQVGWESFPAYAEALLRVLGGTVETRADGPVERIWTVRILGQPFWLAYDDYPAGVSLDARSGDASAILPSILATLLRRRGP